MTSYVTNECSFELPPAAFRDRTMHVLRGTLRGGEELGLVVARHVLPPERSLRQGVTAWLVEVSERLAGFAIVSDREFTYDRAPAIEVSIRWIERGHMLYEHQVHFASGTHWLRFGMCAAWPDRDACEAAMRALLDSLRFR